MRLKGALRFKIGADEDLGGKISNVAFGKWQFFIIYTTGCLDCCPC